MSLDKIPSDDSKTSVLKFMLRSFHYRNYRLFFSGQGISLIGTWIQNIAMSWLVYSLTNSTFLLGVVGFAGQLPVFLLAPFAGVLVDRWNRHRILLVTQTLAMFQALVLALLVLTGNVSVWHIIPISIFLGLINAFDMPARQSFVVQIVEKKEDLGNAIALNSSMFNGARLVGPSIAGILISALGEGICFLLNSISFLAVLAALLAMRVKPKRVEVKNKRILQELKAGFVYAFGFVPIRSIMLLIALISLVGMPYTVLMPVFAKNILQGGPHTLGFLMGFSGLGALTGALYLASQKNARRLVTMVPLAAGIFGIGLIAFAQSRVLWLSLIMMLITGFGMMVQMASSNTMIQTIVDDDKRGRVMSFYTMSFVGVAPFGSLLGGAIASKIGAPATLTIGGIFCVLGALVFTSKLSLLKEIVNPLISGQENSTGNGIIQPGTGSQCRQQPNDPDCAPH